MSRTNILHQRKDLYLKEISKKASKKSVVFIAAVASDVDKRKETHYEKETILVVFFDGKYFFVNGLYAGRWHLHT